MTLAPSHEPFVSRGSSGLLALAWIISVLTAFLFFTTATLFIRRWAAWEDGVSHMPTYKLWEEGWYGGGLVKRLAQDEWRRKGLESQERAAEWRERERNQVMGEADGIRGKGKGKEVKVLPSRQGQNEVVVIVLPPTTSTESFN